MQDLVDAVRYHCLAAEQNHAGAHDRLGVCLRQSMGMAQDTIEPVRSFRLGDQQDNAGVQCKLA